MQLLQDAPHIAPTRPKHLWNSQTARLAALKSVERRRARPFKYPPLPDDAQTVDPQLELVQEQIKRTREELNETKPFCPKCERGPMPPHHRAQLLRALDALLDRERIILGKPLPGSYKPTHRVKGQNGATPAPVGPSPEAG